MCTQIHGDGNQNVQCEEGPLITDGSCGDLATSVCKGASSPHCVARSLDMVGDPQYMAEDRANWKEKQCIWLQSIPPMRETINGRAKASKRTLNSCEAQCDNDTGAKASDTFNTVAGSCGALASPTMADGASSPPGGSTTGRDPIPTGKKLWADTVEDDYGCGAKQHVTSPRWDDMLDEGSEIEQRAGDLQSDVAQGCKSSEADDFQSFCTEFVAKTRHDLEHGIAFDINEAALPWLPAPSA